MVTDPLQLAIVYPGDREARRLATRDNNRFAALFGAFAARGVDARPAVYNPEQVSDLREQLLALDGALVWVNPIEAGRSRAALDDVLRDVAAAGVFVSTHPDVILQMGTKDVLVATRAMAWGSDVHHVDTLAALETGLRERLRGDAVRVLKQWRGHSGIGVWRVERDGRDGDDGPVSAASPLTVQHAQRGSDRTTLRFDEFVARMAPYFDDGGHMVDQAWQPRMTEGMVRCYLVRDEVVGFGLQAVNALYPAPRGASGGEAPTPSTRHYHPPDVPHLQALKHRLETEWVAELSRTLGIARERLPLLWDCDFLRGDAPPDEERFVLCEINVSSVAPFPDSAIAPLVAATVTSVEAARLRRQR